MERVYNFSAGPAMIDASVLEKAASEMLCYGDKGMSVLEMSHRTPMFMDIYNEALALFREIMGVPEGYDVLFLQGGATMEFAAVPLNLMTGSQTADYLDTGNFAHLAAEEAKKYGKVNIVASSKADNYTYIPDLDAISFTPDADYVYITTNNTIYGTRYVTLPNTGSVPLVADASSNILSEPMDVSRFGVIYAGTQKNIGPAGMAIVVVRKDLLGKANPLCPKVLNWAEQAKNDSMINTPNTFAIYMLKLVCEWMKSRGGVPAMYEANQAKAKLLYDYLDNSKLFKNPVQKEYRSLMNVTFVTGDEAKDNAFCKVCTQNGLVNIKGHRNVGGMRASIYNAMPREGVEKLVRVMAQFEKENL
ncbi:MAG TPA: 3-phosphoserine/phosphohydroxythreonine transaminase [Candidatus Limiplasma sp.]|nr:3-phosphoserine/phosphohydroxythreonine transaminase [Candidatus Limiplasma sp.]HPS80475.1 3-phosphoserine/phosphohydroxythreonine transaminase [Candidatus Limiplasma sp.]